MTYHLNVMCLIVELLNIDTIRILLGSAGNLNGRGSKLGQKALEQHLMACFKNLDSHEAELWKGSVSLTRFHALQSDS